MSEGTHRIGQDCVRFLWDWSSMSKGIGGLGRVSEGMVKVSRVKGSRVFEGAGGIGQ